MTFLWSCMGIFLKGALGGFIFSCMVAVVIGVIFLIAGIGLSSLPEKRQPKKDEEFSEWWKRQRGETKTTTFSDLVTEDDKDEN